MVVRWSESQVVRWSRCSGGQVVRAVKVIMMARVVQVVQTVPVVPMVQVIRLVRVVQVVRWSGGQVIRMARHTFYLSRTPQTVSV